MGRILPDVVAHDGAGAELDASLRVVHELAFFQAVDLRRTHVEAGLRFARSADIRVDRDEWLLVELEPVEANPLVDRQRFRGVRFRGLRHEERRRKPGAGNKGWWPPGGPRYQGGQPGGNLL